ncbi:uncharacterized protein LOC129592337 [Paramacrobiotus metropolitanus]|uniref:uncharacterized protein LOC129592337 n=1 Tax=Paramacrobiotus metropolitanus TaxID=2943436 RepID=UPI0024456FFC|nr:uncharacterized protein LOC129592337 [Paramacrobiotus metropolitanus]
MSMVTKLGQDVELAGILQPDAHFRFVCGWMLPTKYFNEDRLGDGWKMIQQLTACMRKMYPKYDVFRGLQLMGYAMAATTALYERVVNGTGRLSGPAANEMVTLAPEICRVVIEYCEEAKEIFTVLFGTESKEVQEADSTLERMTVIIGPIERGFRGSEPKAM